MVSEGRFNEIYRKLSGPMYHVQFCGQNIKGNRNTKDKFTKYQELSSMIYQCMERIPPPSRNTRTNAYYTWSKMACETFSISRTLGMQLSTGIYSQISPHFLCATSISTLRTSYIILKGKTNIPSRIQTGQVNTWRAH